MDSDIKARAKEFAAGDPFPLQGFSHLEWWVGNAYQTAMFLRSMLGFSIVGYRGPETGVDETSSYLLESGTIRFIVTAAQSPEHPVSDHVRLHGPGVKDVAFLVPDAEEAFEDMTSEVRFLVGNPRTGGIGLNLVAASLVGLSVARARRSGSSFCHRATGGRPIDSGRSFIEK